MVPSCSQLLDIASRGKVVAVVRDGQVELWDIATAKKLKSAPFKPARIDAAAFSPDARLLAISDSKELFLWRWEDGALERIELGRTVGSLAFSPNGRLLAEGPTPGEDIQIRDLETRKLVQTLAGADGQPMNVPRLAYAQSGRVLIACDNGASTKGVAVPHRINLWDMADGSLVHQLTMPAGLPQYFHVTPHGRYLVAMLEDAGEIKLSGWRLDGANAVIEPATGPPAAVAPR
jgi:WD40 repeat protein